MMMKPINAILCADIRYANGQLASRTDAEGVQRRYTYDTAGYK